MKMPHAPSCRPAREMIVVPDSSSMAAVGVCRVHVEATEVYCAMLFTVGAVVSVAQIELALENTNPYGLVAVATIRVPPGLSPVGNPENWTIPAPAAPELVPSDQYSVVEVATREPTHDFPGTPDPSPTHPAR